MPNIKKILILMALIGITAGILLVSLSRASLEVMNRDEREGRLRVVPVIIDGRTIYKLPQTNMLPNNGFYIFKEIRNSLWQSFSNGSEKEAKTVLILADKKMGEARTLAEKGKYRLALEASMKAVDKLKYANGLVTMMKNQNTAQKQMIAQVKETSLAYSEIIREIGQKSGADNQKYILLQKEIDDFKDK